MRKAAIIIGSSYGDEGKGLAAAYAARQAGLPCLNVLINGGAQRGHTVDLPDGRRHVFSHFGSATVQGATSCADEDFIVNPLLYQQERTRLREGLGVAPRLIVSARCRVTTPWDMMLGQIIEEQRGLARHGSCGCGVFETRLRYESTPWALRWGDLARLDECGFDAYARRIAEEYLPRRLKELGMALPDHWRQPVHSEALRRGAWLDLADMLSATGTYHDWAEAARDWPFLLFEAGQGLALDQDNRADFPHLTPSSTTSQASARRIAALPGETHTEVIYVSRTYLTRHGAGPFPTECPKAAINPHMLDRTNVPNPHQQALRYGLMDAPAVLRRVDADRRATAALLPAARFSMMVTHLNETGGALTGDVPLADFLRGFDRAYLSDVPWDARPVESGAPL